MADGTVVIDTEMDTSGIEAGEEQIKKSLKRLSKSIWEQKNSAGRLNSKELQNRDEKQKTEGIELITQEYRKASEEVNQLEKRLDLLNEKQRIFLELEGSENESIYRSTAVEIDRLNQKLEQARARLQQMNTAGQETRAGSVGFGASSANASGLMAQENNLAATNNQLAFSFADLRKAVIEYFQSTVSAAIESGVLRERVVSLLSGVKRLAQTALKAALNLAQMAGGGIIGGLKRVSAGIFSVHKNSRKAKNSLGAMLRSGLLMGIAFRAFSKVITGVKEGFDNLAQYSGDTNKSLSMLVSSLEYLKNSFAAAFAPILDVVAPILSRFIDMLATAANYVGAFFSALTGKSTYRRAVKIQKDYAASLENTSSGAKDAAKSTEEAEKAAEGYLSPLDEINKMEKKDNLSDTGSSGIGGSEGISPSEMFDTEEIEPFNFDSWGEAFSAFLDYLLNTGIPTLRNTLVRVADMINVFAANLYKMFIFPGVKEKVQALGEEISESFNGFIKRLDWKTIGSALGAGVNLAIQFLASLVYTFDWQKLGTSLAIMFNRAISKVDWYTFGRLLWSKFKMVIETLEGFLVNLDMGQVASALSQAIVGLLDSATETLNNIDWQKLGIQVATLIAEIDYSGVADSLLRGLGAALASLSEFLWGLIEKAWNSVVNWWRDTAFEDGQFTMEGLLNGILEKLRNIGSWIREHIFQPFIDGFKEAFGINSPSTVMMQMGMYLMQGLFMGVDSLKEKIVEIFGEIKERVSLIWENLKQITFSIWSGIENSIRSAVNGIIGFLNGMISGIVSAVNTVVNTLNRFHVDVPDVIAELSGIHSFGFDLQNITAPRIPYLASGAVIPPNSPFLAMLGDQKNGNNLEMPESLLRKIVREES
ncbi:MAG: hypothetical protein KH452_01695, partial [Clostridiales bacterium]|nr:hypothetical protein [Clostridiales bacterium]